MTELQLYKFINEHGLEYHWWDEDVILFISFRYLEEWNKLIEHQLEDEGVECTMKDGYMCFMMNDICESADINLNNVFDKNKEF